MSDIADLTYYQENKDRILNKAKDYYKNNKKRLREQARDNIFKAYLKKKKIKPEHTGRIVFIICPKKRNKD